jgi:2,3-bisphosphoglycerate-dependent phosphoglycerate mutase
VISDEIYEHIVYDGHVHYSLAAEPGMAERTIIVNGFSKAYAMTGWRLGWLAGPQPIVALARIYQTHSAQSAASFTMAAGVAALNGPQDCVREMTAAYDRGASLCSTRFEEIPGIECPPVEGAFYIFPRFTATRKNSLEITAGADRRCAGGGDARLRLWPGGRRLTCASASPSAPPTWRRCSTGWRKSSPPCEGSAVRLLLVRHGQSMNNLLAETLPYDEYIATRSNDPELTPAGAEQAQRLAHFFGDITPPDEVDTARRTSISERPVTALYTSPMLRALRTTAPLAAALGLAPQVWTEIFEHGGLFTGDPRAGEVVNFGGLTRQQMAAHFPTYVLPAEVTDEGWWWDGYEHMAQCTARARRVAQTLRQWAETSADAVILLVTHGTFMDQLIKALLDAGEQPAFHFSHINTAISRLDFLAEGFVAVRYLNRAPHLPLSIYTR